MLFVGHGGINTALVKVILDKSNEYINHMKNIRNLSNASLSIFEIREGKDTVVALMNSTAHLR